MSQTSPREILVLRLDRIGDVILSLPALAELRAALPHARIRLAVGQWSEPIARHAPVDEVLIWSAPWVGRSAEGAESWTTLARKARTLRAAKLDVAIDLQGDVRATLLAWLTGARRRVGYANTGGGGLLTDVVPLDETVSWAEQNRRAIAVALGAEQARQEPDPRTAEDRAFAERLIENLGLEGRRPLVGIHPSGGRRVKQWDMGRWRELARTLQREFSATILLTGAADDRTLASVLTEGLRPRAVDLIGRLSVRETLALIGALDLFLSPDTGPMHMACAVDTPSVAVFGPSDPTRYFAPGGNAARHRVVRADLWCSPCNLIRNPPHECRGIEPPECLQLVSVSAVFAEAARLLEASGFTRREAVGGLGNQ